jgi:transposase
LPAQGARGVGFVRRETSIIKSPFGISVNVRVVMMIFDGFRTGCAFIDP